MRNSGGERASVEVSSLSAIKPDASLKTKSPIQENEPNDEKKKNEKRILINEEDNEIILIPSRGHGRNLSSQRPIMGLSGSRMERCETAAGGEHSPARMINSNPCFEHVRQPPGRAGKEGVAQSPREGMVRAQPKSRCPYRALTGTLEHIWLPYLFSSSVIQLNR